MMHIVYTADDEEPDCIQCDHVRGWTWTDYKGKEHDNCSERCGAEHGWYRYKRTEELYEGKMVEQMLQRDSVAISLAGIGYTDETQKVTKFRPTHGCAGKVDA